MNAIVELKDISRLYRVGSEEVRALDGVSLSVEAGEFLSVMGRSGSGKSTLLNMIGCLDRPTSGTVTINGECVTGLSGARLADIRSHRIGFVFQMHNLIPNMSALENVMLPLRYAGIDDRKAKAAAALDLVGLSDRIKHKAIDLSGGQRQRVAIARALVTQPDIVLADEPTGQLDSHLSDQVIGLMRRLNRELGQTFIIVTHDPSVAAHTNRTIVFLDGKIIRDERKRQDPFKLLDYLKPEVLMSPDLVSAGAHI